jgi:hypothetical protein
MKKAAVFSLFLFLISGCKKDDSSNDAAVSLIGTWSSNTLSTKTPNNQPYSSYSAADYPCIADNKVTFIQGGTIEGKYTGTTSCTLPEPNGGSLSIGGPGSTITGTFIQNGNAITMVTSTGTSNCTLSTGSDGKAKLSCDYISPTNYTITSVFVK